MLSSSEINTIPGNLSPSPLCLCPCPVPGSWCPGAITASRAPGIANHAHSWRRRLHLVSVTVALPMRHQDAGGLALEIPGRKAGMKAVAGTESSQGREMHGTQQPHWGPGLCQDRHRGRRMRAGGLLQRNLGHMWDPGTSSQGTWGGPTPLAPKRDACSGWDTCVELWLYFRTAASQSPAQACRAQCTQFCSI